MVPLKMLIPGFERSIGAGLETNDPLVVAKKPNYFFALLLLLLMLLVLLLFTLEVYLRVCVFLSLPLLYPFLLLHYIFVLFFAHSYTFRFLSFCMPSSPLPPLFHPFT